MAIALLTPSNVVAILCGVAILLLKQFRSSSRRHSPFNDAVGLRVFLLYYSLIYVENTLAVSVTVHSIEDDNRLFPSKLCKGVESLFLGAFIIGGSNPRRVSKCIFIYILQRHVHYRSGTRVAAVSH